MTEVWNEDGVDDNGVRMFDHTAESIATEEAAVAEQVKSNQQRITASSIATAAATILQNNAGSGGAGAGGRYFGHQRQVQHLREVHRQKMEQLKNEEPDDTSSDEEERGRGRESSPKSQQKEDRGFAVNGGGAGRQQQHDDQAGGQSPATGQQKKSVHVRFSPTPAVMRRYRDTASGGNNSSLTSSSFTTTTPGGGTSGKKTSSSPSPLPGSSVASRYRGANNDFTYPTKIVPKKEVERTSTNLQRYRQLQKMQQRQRSAGFDGTGSAGGSGYGSTTPSSSPTQSGSVTPSFSESTAAELPTMLDIGSDKLPLRFFPDGRTLSTWRGVVRPSNAKHLKRRWSHSAASLLAASDGGGAQQQQSSAPARAPSPALVSATGRERQLNFTPPKQLPHKGRKTPIFDFGAVRESSPLKHTHLTVFNTFCMPDSVPSAHKQRNFNPVQENIARALPHPKSDVDVAILRKHSDETFNDGTRRTNDVLADVRRVVLDDVRHNRHRVVQRQQELSPQRLPRHPREVKAQQHTTTTTAAKKKQKKSISNSNEYDDEDADTAAADEEVDTEEVAQRKAKEREEQEREKKRQRLLAGIPVDESDDDIDDFTHADDEKVVVGGDVIGGAPKLLPKARGRWDAMNDAIKARYFSAPPPPVEPIGHALRVIPLAELCSMYRCSIKEFKGAIEMDQRIFGSLVRMMMMALPGNIKLTEQEITKYYFIFDMNGNGGISFIEFLTTVVDFQTDIKEMQFLRSCFNHLLLTDGQDEAVATEDLSARAPWRLLEDEDVLFDCVLKGLKRSARFPRVVEKTFATGLAKSLKSAHREAESAMCQESSEGLFWEQFRLLVCLDPDLILPLRHMRL